MAAPTALRAHRRAPRARQPQDRCTRPSSDRPVAPNVAAILQTIIDAHALGCAASPPGLHARPTANAVRKPARTALEERIAELEAEVADLQLNKGEGRR